MTQINIEISDFTEDFEIKLAELYRELIPLGCTYLYYTINNPKVGRLRFNTDDNWMNVYLGENLIKYDPVKISCEKKISRILTWDNLPIADKNQKKTMEARESYKIYNGLNFIEYDKLNDTHKILALCTDSKSHNFSKEIFNDEPRLKNIFNIFKLV